MRLIDADALLEKSFKYRMGEFTTMTVVLANKVKIAPTIDAVPVVRCKDCKRRGTDDCPMHIKGTPVDEEFLSKVDNDFCSYGERKGEVSE